MIDWTNLSRSSAIRAEDKQLIQKVLVIRRGGIGDIIMATPALRMLAARLPGVRLDLLVQQGAAEAAFGLPYIETIHEVDSRSNAVSLYRLRKLAHRLCAIEYDLIVNLQPGAKTNYLANAARPRLMLNFRKDRSMQTETGRVRHAIDDFAHALLPLGIGDLCDRSLDFVVPDAARARLNNLLLASGYCVQKPSRPLVVINPTARRIVNRWPALHWAGLVDDLSRSGEFSVAVIGAGRDLRLVNAVKSLSRNWGSVIDFSGRITLKELGALLEHAAAFVTADTGPMHVGSAVGAPIVCLSGAADPCRTGPDRSGSMVLIDRTLPCVPCQNKNCRYSRLPLCMEKISMEQVAGATRKTVSRSSAFPLSVLQV